MCLLEGKEKDPAVEVDVLIGGGVRYAVPMGKNLGLVVIAALLLTGCASGEEPAAVETPTVAVGVNKVSSQDDEYLEQLRPTLDEYATAPDEGLIAFAPEFCEQAADGYTLEDMRVGARQFNNAARTDEMVEMGRIALSVYCPEYTE